MKDGFDIPEFSFESRVPNDKSGRMKRLLDGVCEHSPIAAAVIADARKKGCRFDFMSGIDGYIGFFDAKANAVCLNLMCSNDELATTLIHEARHAFQPRYLLSAERNIRTNIQINRAKEADAMAFECAAAFEMREKRPSSWRLFKQEHPQIAIAYTRAERDGQNGLSEAFKAWHDDAGYVSEYDRDVLGFLSARLRRAERGFLSRNMTAREVAGLFCRHGYEMYLDPIEFLSSKRALSVDENTMRQINAIAAKAELRYGIRDASVPDLTVRTEERTEGGFVPPTVAARTIIAAGRNGRRA